MTKSIKTLRKNKRNQYEIVKHNSAEIQAGKYEGDLRAYLNGQMLLTARATLRTAGQVPPQ